MDPQTTLTMLWSLVMVIVNNRTDTLQTDINVFYDNKLLNCPLSLADASPEFEIHVCVCLHVAKH